MPSTLLESGTNKVEILEFYIDEEGYRGYYGANVAKVMEIIPMPKVNINLPSFEGTPTVGMFNHRGQSTVIVDLATWLGRSRIEGSSSTLVITKFNDVVSAFIVSGVTRIHRLTWGDIKPLGEYIEGPSENITGLIHLESRIIFFLDLEKAIADLNPNLSVTGTSADPPEDMALARIAYPIKVLHVDDSTVIRNSVKRRLQETNVFSVVSAVNGDEAWARLLEIKDQARNRCCRVSDMIEIVLTDIEMPGTDGYHLCKMIKEDPELKSLPVVLFSSLLTDRLLHRGNVAGADGQFAKPELRMMARMRALVEERRKAISQ